MLQSEGQVSAVFVGQCPNRQLHIGEIDPFVIGEDTTNSDCAVQGLLRLFHRVDLHLNPAVIEQDAASCGDFVGKFVVSDCGNALIAAHRTGCEGKWISIGQSDRPIGEATQANLWPLEILKDPNVLTQF